MIPTVLDRFPTPACAQLLGLDLLAADAERGWVRIGFVARPEFCNASGAIQGGLIAAMLDDAMGPAVLIRTGATHFPTTINLNVSYLASARPGPLFAEASVVQQGKTVGFVEAVLMDAEGRRIASATASVRLLPLAQP